jgi:NAD(P)-dependent dehydrogenase (short-subunit alcohol dehydrogenase family)
VNARLAGRTVVVTGASSGLGAAVCRGAAAERARVVGFARRFSSTDAAPPPPGEVREAAIDVTSEEQVAARFAAVGPIDALVCAAGSGSFAPVIDTAVADLRAMLEVHVVGTFLCARAMLAARAGAPRPGHIVVVSSVAALRTFTSSGAYSAAKEGQRGLARVLVDEARPYGVRVTALGPGAVDTPLWDPRPGFDRARMMQPEELAGLVVELLARPELAVEELLVMPPGGAL